MRFPDYVFLGRLGQKGPRLAFQRVSEAKEAKNRMHLDLAAADPEALITRVLARAGAASSTTSWTASAGP